MRPFRLRGTIRGRRFVARTPPASLHRIHHHAFEHRGRRPGRRHHIHRPIAAHDAGADRHRHGARVRAGVPHLPVQRPEPDPDARSHLPVLPLRRVHRSRRAARLEGGGARERIHQGHDPAGNRRQDLERGRQAHQPVVHLFQPGRQVPRHRHARPVDQRRHRGQLRHHRPHAQRGHAGGLRHAHQRRWQRELHHRRARPAHPHAVATGSPAGPRRGVVQHQLILVQRVAAGAAVLLVDERRHQGEGQAAVRLPGHELPGPCGRARPVAARRRQP